MRLKRFISRSSCVCSNKPDNPAQWAAEVRDELALLQDIVGRSYGASDDFDVATFVECVIWFKILFFSHAFLLGFFLAPTSLCSALRP